MSAAQMRLDVAAGNLANGSTGGFRKSAVSGYATASGLVMRRTSVDSEGSLRHTGRPFDLAIIGPGNFRVRDARGRITATRDGSFVRDRFGHLIDSAGRVLLNGAKPVIVLQDAQVVRIPLPPGSSLRSGFLEGSNVDAIGEMIDVMTAQRSFEAAQKVLTAIDGTRERAVTQVAQVKA